MQNCKVDPHLVLDSPQFWTDAFMLIAYVMALACIYRAVRRGAGVRRESGQPTKSGTRAVLWELLVFSTFVVLLWGLESMARFRIPYYVYSPAFRDVIPEAPLGWLVSAPESNPCTTFVRAVECINNAKGIPLCVVLFEASLTHAAMYAARTAHAFLPAQPFLSGLYLANLDLFLDPIVARTHDCPSADSGLRSVEVGSGLGFWHWFLPSDGQQGVKNELLAHWFTIPLFNYVAWIAAPITLVALVNLLGPFRRAFVRRKTAPEQVERHKNWHGWFLGVLIFMPIAVIWAAPTTNLSPLLQWGLLLLLIGIAVVAFFRASFRHFRWKRVPDRTLTVPSTVALIMPLVAGVLVGRFPRDPWLLVVGILVILVGLWFAWLPYLPSIENFIARVGAVGRFVRLHYFGFSSTLILAGAAPGRLDPSTPFVIGILGIAAVFHVFAYVHNDLIDLPLDRQQPLRQDDPLVTGAVSVPTGYGVALGGIPLAFLLVIHLVHFRPHAIVYPCLALLVGFVLMTVYNFWGKRCSVPPLTDLVQGMAWGCLAIVGALVAEPKTTLQDFMRYTLPVFAYGTFFLLLINGIHGGLRDLVVDMKNDRKTTARFLGARPVDPDDPTKGAVTTPLLQLFAHVVHLLIFGSAASFVYMNPFAFRHLTAIWVALGLVFAVSLYILVRVVRRNEPRRNDLLGYHLSWLLMIALVVVAGASHVSPCFRIVIVVTAVFPLVLRADILKSIVEFAYLHSAPRDADRRAEYPAGSG